jgi:membrane protein DedA with SNARE-associated domain/membrane-associated phospholipid phosphatase
MSAGQVVAAVVAVLLVGFAGWRRRRLGVERALLLVACAVALAVYASGVLSVLPDPKTAIEDIARALGPWTYLLVGALAFLETGAFVGLIAPGETVVIAGGVIAGQGEISLMVLIGIVWSCAVLGDTASFFIGRRLGRRFLERHGPKLKITPERLGQVERYFDRHGGKTILIGRFIGLVRAIAPFVAGSSGLAFRRVFPYSVVGAGLWSTLFCVLGYVFWHSFDRVAHVAGQAVFAFGVVVAAIVGGAWAYRRLRDPEQRRRMGAWLDRRERLAVVGPVIAAARRAARAVAPEVRFVWRRLTPGELGLELTTLLAVAGVGFYVFAVYAVILSGDPGPTPFDRELLHLADGLRAGVAVDAAKLVTSLGSVPTVAAGVAVTAVMLAVRRRPVELIALVAGLLMVYAAVHAAKAGIDRPRPARPLVETALASYPSGHAAYSTAWVAAAVAATWRLGVASRTGLVVAALGLSAAIGVTRIYLRTHYWSDVAGGWGLGAGVFATLAAIALVVTHIRHNGARDVAPSAKR